MTAADIMREEMEVLRGEIIARSQEAGQQASGETYQNVTIDATATRGELWAPQYIGVLAQGRKPGKVPYDMPQIIMDWAATKGISFGSEEEFERWAQAVAWKIRREGTKLYRDLAGGELDIFNSAIVDFFGRLTTRITRLYIADLQEHIYTAWQNM